MSQLNLFCSYRDLTREIQKELKEGNGDRLEELIRNRGALQEKIPPASQLSVAEKEQAIELLLEIQQIEGEVGRDLQEALQELGSELNKVEQARQLTASYLKLEDANGLPRMIDRRG